MVSLLPVGAGAYSASGWLYILPVKSNDPFGYLGTYGEISQQDPICASGQAYASSSNQIRFDIGGYTAPFTEVGLTKSCTSGKLYPYIAYGGNGDPTFYETSYFAYPTVPAEYVATEVDYTGGGAWSMNFNYHGTVIGQNAYLNQYVSMPYAASGAEAGMSAGLSVSCYGCPTGYSNHRNLMFNASDTNGYIPWACYDRALRQNNNPAQILQPTGCPHDSEFSINS